MENLIRIILISIPLVAGQEPTPIVGTKYGPVQGTRFELHNEKSVNSFLSVPFGRPPVDELRFMPSEEPEPWEEVYQATELGPACMQALVNIIWVSHPGWTYMDEDCLHMNIYTPANMDSSYPVMVWFYGGSYQGGANVQYPGYFLASQDVVVVVPNYRVQNLGFAYTDDGVIPGNAGMHDQVLALRWVQENIAAFGGDPDKVTIFGESAGGASTGLHVVSPMSAGLFHQAIPQSGSDMVIWAVNEPESQPENYIKSVAEQVNCPAEDSQEMLECLQSTTARRIVNADVNCTQGYLCVGMAPVVDGSDGFMPDMPLEIRRRNEHNAVPEMIGMLKEDGYLFVPLLVPSFIFRGANRSEVETIFSEIADYFTPSYVDEDRTEDVYEALLFQYTDWANKDDPEINRAMIGDAITDAYFLVAADWQAKHHSQTADTYFYVYGHTTEDRRVPDWMGAYHASEIVYEFGLPFLALNEAVRNHSGITFNSTYTEFEMEFSQYMMELWTNFAKFGSPTTETTTPPGSDIPITWPKFSEDQYYYNYLDANEGGIRMNYRQREMAFWNQYLNQMVGLFEPADRLHMGKDFTMYPTEFLDDVFEILGDP